MPIDHPLFHVSQSLWLRTRLQAVALASISRMGLFLKYELRLLLSRIYSGMMGSHLPAPTTATVCFAMAFVSDGVTADMTAATRQVYYANNVRER